MWTRAGSRAPAATAVAATRVRGAVALALLLGSCAELTVAPPSPPPPELAAGNAAPTRAAIDLAAAGFTDAGAGLAGRPIEAALAAARLEYLADALPADPRYGRLPSSLWRDLALARGELRDALGVAESAAAGPVTASLLAAARALRGGDAAAAARALPNPLFRPGGAGSVARLGEIGPLPQGAIATAAVAQVVARQEVDGGGFGGRPEEVAAGGFTTGGVPRDAGY